MATPFAKTKSQADDLYVLATSPEVQEYMAYDWFATDCFACKANEGQEQLPTAYFIPVRRILEIEDKGYSESLL